MTVKVFKQKSSTRFREKDNRPFVDFYISWTYNSQPYAIKIKPQFASDYDKLFAMAEEVPAGELIDKYLQSFPSLFIGAILISS